MGPFSKVLLLVASLCLFMTVNARPQVSNTANPSATQSVQPASPTVTKNSSATHQCNFDSLDNFFSYVHDHGLNVTLEVEACLDQDMSLCELSYGFGNPDLSGIGMMSAYTIQVILTVLFGPVFQVLYLILPRLKWASSFNIRPLITESADIQVVFFEANGFLIFSTAVSALVRWTERPQIFEIAEMQVLMFVQVCSLLIIFFCLVHPIQRWWQRFFQFIVGFVLAAAALGRSRIVDSETNADLLATSLACIADPIYLHITPVPVQTWVVAIVAVVCLLSFIAQSLMAKYPEFGESGWRRMVVKGSLVLWSLSVIAAMVGMFIGLVILWRQRTELKSIIGEKFEDDSWGFGQVAALFIWMPILVEISYRINDWLKERYPWFSRLDSKFHQFKTPQEQAGTSKPIPGAPASTSMARSPRTSLQHPRKAAE